VALYCLLVYGWHNRLLHFSDVTSWRRISYLRRRARLAYWRFALNGRDTALADITQQQRQRGGRTGDARATKLSRRVLAVSTAMNRRLLQAAVAAAGRLLRAITMRASITERYVPCYNERSESRRRSERRKGALNGERKHISIES